MIVKLLTEHHLEFLSLTGGCRVSSESTLKMSNCWKSHAAGSDIILKNNNIALKGLSCMCVIRNCVWGMDCMLFIVLSG